MFEMTVAKEIRYNQLLDIIDILGIVRARKHRCGKSHLHFHLTQDL